MPRTGCAASICHPAILGYAGKWIERTESVNLTELFDKMSTPELEEYARSGKLPAWFPVATVATGNDSPRE